MLIIKKLWLTYISYVVDILILVFLFYYLMKLLKGTQAIQIFFGLLILGLFTLIANLLHLRILNWILSNFWLVGVIIVAIIFQPELRKIFAEIGSQRLGKHTTSQDTKFINEIVSAFDEFSKNRIGAIVVLEQKIGLEDYNKTGVMINGEVTRELLMSIFYPGSILHDGAVIIKNGRLVSAGCILPISEESTISRFSGLRHRAALGLSEITDAIIIVASEETGKISFVYKTNVELIENISELKKKIIAHQSL